MQESILFGADIDDRSLDDAVDEVNESFADATADVSADISGPGMSGVGGGVRGPTGDVSDDVAALVPMADYRNRLLEDILDERQAGGGMGDGDGGGPLGSLRNLLGGVSLGALLPSLITGATITSGMLVGSLASITAGSLIANRADISPGDLINNPVSVGQQALLEGLIASPVGLTANAVLNHVFGEGAGKGDSQPSGDPSGGGGGIGLGGLLGALGIGGGIFAGLNRGAIGGAIRGVGGRIGGFGRGIMGGLSGLAGIPAKAYADLVGRDILRNPAEGLTDSPQMALTGPLGGSELIRQLFSTQTRSPRQRSANSRDSRWRNDPAANPSQVNASAEVTVDPSGMDDLKRQIKTELEQTLVSEVVSQVERELSIGAGGF